MVDPYQASIDNGNSTSTNCDTPKLSVNLAQNMNETDTPQHQLIQQQQQQEQQQQHQQEELELRNSVTNNTIEVITANDSENDECNEQVNFSEIMCGPSAKHGTNSKIATTTTTNADASDNELSECTESDSYRTSAILFQNGDLDFSAPRHFSTDIEAHSVTSGNNNNNSADSLVIGSSEVCSVELFDDQSNESNSDSSSANVNSIITEHLNSAQQSPSEINAVPEEEIETSDSPLYIIDSADPKAISTAELPTNRNSTTDNNQITQQTVSATSSEMDSRKVEPLRININREPIKTKIKLGDRQASSMSPSSTKYSVLSDNVDEVDDVVHETQSHVIPKITIKTIAKPSNEAHTNDRMVATTGKKQNSTLSALLSEKSQKKTFLEDDFVQSTTEGLKTAAAAADSINRPTIPKLKIKKVDSTSSTLENITNYNANSNVISHTVLSASSSSSSSSSNADTNSGNSSHQNQSLAESTYSVPKLTATRSSTKNLSTDSNSVSEDLYEDDDASSAINSNNSCKTSASNELVPKLTIKLDNHQHSNDSTHKEVSRVSKDGVKVTLKPLAEPPLPKFTIKTNVLNDTAKVIMVNNASNEHTDESSDEQPQSQPPSCQPSPNDKNSLAISSTSSNSSNSAHNTEDNLSTCSSGSSSSFTSSISNISGSNNDIKLIIKSTSTGSCVVSPNTTTNVRNSTSSKNSVGVKANNKLNSDQSKQNNSAANMVTSSTSNSGDAIPKLNIKLSSTDYAQLKHGGDNDRSESPLPKITIRKTVATDENIVIPKVTIKPLVKPNDYSDAMSAEAPLKTPKIILKPIPKPIDKPLEIITAPSSPFRSSAENESQQSPRIILKINKSQTKESSLSSTTIISDDLGARSNSPSVTSHNELKRSNFETDIQAKKPKLMDDVVQLLSSDSDSEESPTPPEQHNNHNDRTETLSRTAAIDPSTIISNTSSSYDSNSGLRSILSRPQMKIQPPQPLQNFLQALPSFKAASENSNDTKTNDVIDLCHDSNDQLLGAADSQSNDTSEEQVTSAQKQVSEPTAAKTVNQNSADAKKSYNWQKFFYGPKENEPPQVLHPLLQQNIERANVLAAMMEAANKRDETVHTPNGSNNNNSTSKDEFSKSLASTGGLLLENDGSSSDCIVIEDAGSNSFPPGNFASGEATTEQNSQKKDSVDRDSGVDVSSSLKSISGDDEVIQPLAKRPRGRPRKGTTPAKPDKQKINSEMAKRKFTGVLMPDKKAMPNETQVEQLSEQSALSNKQSPSSSIAAESIASNVHQTTVLTASGTMTITSTTATEAAVASILPQLDSTETENNITIAPIDPIMTLDSNSQSNHIGSEEPMMVDSEMLSSVLPNSVEAQSSCELPPIITTATPPAINNVDGLMLSPSSILNAAPESMSLTATTPSVPKERKRRIVIDDDDESPTFNPLSRSSKKRGKNRRKGQNLLRQKQLKAMLLSPNKLARENAVFTSPEGIDQSRRKVLFKDATTPALQVFEEDTRMSADSLLFTSPTNRTSEFLQNEESQSSLHSSTSATIESTTKKIRSKIEVADPEGKTEFTVDMIAEYDWPPPKGCCPSRNRDAYMVQEQIAEYLGVKSFKRKYPDLPRRTVEMEERNYLLEKGMVSEKMCDLGLTAVLASDVLDIMHTDFYEKYEEYRRYLRDKQIRDLAARQKSLQANIIGKSLSARENAMRAASMWNTNFNQSRKESRRECLDLQNFIVQVPEVYRNPANRTAKPKPSSYPVALVPGQFQEYYKQYSAAELLCYPINSVLADPYQLDRKLREYYNKSHHLQSDDDDDSDSDSSSCCSTCSDSDSSDDSSSDSDSSSDDEIEVKDEKNPTAVVKTETSNKPEETEKKVPKLEKTERDKCSICSGPERANAQKKPEIFVSCTTCQRNAHPTCLKMSSRTVRRVNEYAWQCKNCKYCIKCRRTENDDKMLFCDQCDRGYHIYCIGLRKVPTVNWHCAVCTVCTLCGARRPEGHNNPNLTPQQKQKLLAVAKWTHEYQENPVTKKQEHISMLCTSCVAIKHSAAKNAYFS